MSKYRPFNPREEFASPVVRRDLHRLCRVITGDAVAADDLVQETLFEALRHTETLPRPQEWRPWLNGVARNVCRRHLRSRRRQASRHTAWNDSVLLAEADASPSDIDALIERTDMVMLLDRLLPLLPAPARDLLIAHYVHETPLSESAERWGLSENMVSVRLHRIKQTVHRRLMTDPSLRSLAHTYGLIRDDTADGWQETPIWCRWCGNARIVARLVPSDVPEFDSNCPRCNPRFEPMGDATSRNAAMDARAVFGNIRAYKPALNRLHGWWNDWYQRGIRGAVLPCGGCGKTAARMLDTPSTAPKARSPYPVYVRCDACHAEMHATPVGIAMRLPEALHFWRRHPRLQVIRETPVHFNGCAALHLGFETVGATTVRLNILMERRTFATLHVEER